MKDFHDEDKEYWDDTYAKYWQDRVKESEDENSESLVLKGDVKTEGDWVYKNIFDKDKFISGSLLDVGCAWGRLFDIYLEHNLKITGLDISNFMLQEAYKLYGANSNISLDNGLAEKLPYESNSFNNVVCVAVFDATYQDKALSEFLRVLAPGGKLYLTGKSNKYLSSDQLAIDAEIGARKKGHPNFFTDLDFMIYQLEKYPLKILSSYLFPKRGDFAKFNFETSLSSTCYEWFLVIQLNKDLSNFYFQEFSFEFSDTFNKLLR